MQEIITTEWFQAMIEDCEAIITERRFNSAMELIQCKWEIGNRILEDWDNIERFKYGSKIVETLSKILGMSPSHLYKCIEFARKFKTWNEAEESLPEFKPPEQLKAELSYIWERKIETPEEIIVRLTREAGTDTKIALAIAECESGLNPEAKHKNRDGSIDRGLWQWNSLAHPEVYDDCAYDAECSTRKFIEYQQANHLSPWVCYSTGRYKKYLK